MEFGELLTHFLLDLQRAFRRQISHPGVTTQQVLLLVSVPEDGIAMSALAQTLGVDLSTVTRLVDGARRKGWVEKVRSRRDRRVTTVYLTPKGETLRESIDEKIDRFGAEFYESLPLEDRDEFKEILSSFHWSFSKYLLKR